MNRDYSTICLSGPSGAGKTVLGGWLFNLLPGLGIPMGRIISTTTRAPRDSDPAGEYSYISRVEFERLKRRNAFAWTTPVYADNQYGTQIQHLAQAIDDSKKAGKMYIIIILPRTIPTVIDYIENAYYSSMLCFYIDCRDQEELRRRLRGRGDQDMEIERRIAESLRFRSDIGTVSRRHKIYEINNNQNDGLESAKEQILAVLRKEEIIS